MKKYLFGSRISSNGLWLRCGNGRSGHDQRDYEFATAYGLEIKQVIQPSSGAEVEADLSKEAFTEKGTLINSGEFDGLDFAAAFEAIASKLEQMGVGMGTGELRLRDWGVSRQRYWGSPIPMLNKDGSELAATPEMLPVRLPEDVVMDGVTSPIKADPEWAKASVNGETVFHETDAFDTFMESSWYYARCSPRYAKACLSAANYWLPVNQYIGGIEHAILHLLYARCFHKLLRDFGLVNSDEPFERLLCQGMVLADTYYRKDEKGGDVWIAPTDVETETDDKGRIIKAWHKDDGEPVFSAGMINVEVEKQRYRPANGDQAIRCRHRAFIYDVHRSARANPRVVRFWSRRCTSLPTPYLEIRR